MIKTVFLAPVFALFLSSFAFSQSYEEIVTIEGACSIEFKPKGFDGDLQKFIGQFHARGFLVGHKNHFGSDYNAEYVATAGHVTSCKPNSKSDFLGFDIVSFVLSEVLVDYMGTKYEAIVKKEADGLGDINTDDKALLAFLLPKNVKHKHFELAKKKFKYKIGDGVFVEGFLSFGHQKAGAPEEWKRIYQFGKIVDISDFYIHIGFMTYGGMSGSPLLIEKRSPWHFWKKKKHVIGVVAYSFWTPSGEHVPYSWASKVNKDFLK